MKIIALTQRVEKVKSYDEERDSLDVRWEQFILSCGFIPLLFPNDIRAVKLLLNRIQIDGIILTGGNSLVKYGGDAPQRDAMERFLIEYSMEKDIPLVGVCRGMQVIQDYFGVILNEVEGHIAVKHQVELNGKKEKKNSYHLYASKISTEELDIIAAAEDGVVEAVQHYKHKIYAIMWHPERNNPFETSDLEFFKKYFTS